MTDRTARRVLLGLVVLAAALRFWRIGHQSFWLDEVFTAGLVNEDLWGLLKGVRETESTPHLYYLLAWLWEKVAGDGEAALRSLSALFGIATVPVVYAAARELFERRAALIAAALAAVNPWFVWHAQEARSYALLVLLAAVSLLFFLRALRDPSRRSLTLWAVFSALAVLTHYFAAFTVGAEALWLLWARRERPVRIAAGALVAVGVALAPLALSQRATGHTAFIEGISLGRRITDLPKRFVTGELGTPTPGIGPLAGLLVAAGAALLVWRAARAERTAALGLAALAGVTVALPVAMAAAGVDYVLPRNVIAAFVPAMLALAAGFAAHRAGPWLAAGLCALAVAVSIQVSFNASLQRDDWRGLAEALGRPSADRILVLNPQTHRRPLEHYAGPLDPLPPDGAIVGEVDAIFITRDGVEREPEPPLPAFAEASRASSPSWELRRLRAPAPLGVGAFRAEAARLGEEPPFLALQRPR